MATAPAPQPAPRILVRKDYNGYFLSLVKSWYVEQAHRGLKPRRSKVIISAGPHNPAVLHCLLADGGQTLEISFYSGMRAGFGALSRDEVQYLITDIL